jgi:hypothetical protein
MPPAVSPKNLEGSKQDIKEAGQISARLQRPQIVAGPPKPPITDLETAMPEETEGSRRPLRYVAHSFPQNHRGVF